ncbi:MAG: putative dehydrogenase [Leifsonia sp.]|jgi:predicted dehydrogenase|nr:putative dehydrogenase [Leifsonia sp.]
MPTPVTTASPSQSTIRFGLVGAGSIAAVHARAIANTAGAQLTACFSRSPAGAQAFAAEFGCDAVLSLAELLARDDCDVIVITTPSGSHAEIGIQAAHQKKHVLCEKPLDISLDAIDRLITACESNGVLLGVVSQSRFGPGALALKHAIDQGRFGRLAQCSAYVPWLRTDEYYAAAPWRGTLADDGGALLNQGLHAVDLLLWLAGDVRTVSAKVQTRIHDIETEDNAVAWLEFDNGGLGVIQCSTCCYPGESKRIEVKGQYGSVTLVDDVPVLWEFATATPDDDEIVHLREDAVVGLGASDPKAVAEGGHRAQYQDFVAAVAEGRPPAVTGTEARRSVQLIRAIYASSESGETVRL